MYKHFPTIKTYVEKILALYASNKNVSLQMLLNAIDVTEEQFHDGECHTPYFTPHVCYLGAIPELIAFKLIDTVSDLSTEDKATVKLMCSLIATAQLFGYRFSVKDCKEIVADYTEAYTTNPKLSDFSPLDFTVQVMCYGLNLTVFKHLNLDLARFFRNIQTYMNKLDYANMGWRTPVCNIANGLITPDVETTRSAYDKFLEGVKLDTKQLIQFITSAYDGNDIILTSLMKSSYVPYGSTLPYGDIIKEALRTDINIPTLTPRLKHMVRMILKWNVFTPYEIDDDASLEQATKRICKLCLNNRNTLQYSNDIINNLALSLYEINVAYDMASYRNKDRAYTSKKEFVLAYLDNVIRTAPKLDYVVTDDVKEYENASARNRTIILWKAFGIKDK